MLECNGKVQRVPESTGNWVINYAPRSNIPYITDGHKRMWCMQLFQSEEEDPVGRSMAAKPVELDLDQINEAENRQPVLPAPVRGMTGVERHWVAHRNHF